jgi:hypothetical protein
MERKANGSVVEREAQWRGQVGGTMEMAGGKRGRARSQARGATVSFFFFFFLENYDGQR